MHSLARRKSELSLLKYTMIAEWRDSLNFTCNSVPADTSNNKIQGQCLYLAAISTSSCRRETLRQPPSQPGLHPPPPALQLRNPSQSWQERHLRPLARSMKRSWLISGLSAFAFCHGIPCLMLGITLNIFRRLFPEKSLKITIFRFGRSTFARDALLRFRGNSKNTSIKILASCTNTLL